ncbi:MAG: hypothetical protein HYS13_11185 [Planctomycetia bacterium]|nr:hypothetical protein [Planctomycetia bacterium]
MRAKPGLFALCLVFALAAAVCPLASAQDNAAQPKPAPQESAQPASQPAPADNVKDPAAALLSKLSPDNMRAVAEMLDRDWKDKPEWAEMAVAVLRGDEMRVGSGWWRPSTKRYDWKWLRANFDADADGTVSAEEFVAQCPSDLTAILPKDKLFERLDKDYSSQLAPDDFDWFSRQIIPDPRRMMGDYMFLMLDADGNGRVTPDELQEFFKQSDQGAQGFLTPEDLSQTIARAISSSGGRGGGGPDSADVVRMFFGGELGTFEAGPNVGDLAPDFTLPTHDGSRTFTLSESRGKRPVILIFGSFS